MHCKMLRSFIVKCTVGFPQLNRLATTLRKSIVSMNTSSRVGQGATVFSILSLFNCLLNEATCPLVQYSLLSEHALWKHLHTYACSLTRLSVLNVNKINTTRGTDTVSCAEKLPAEHGLLFWKMTKWTRFIFSVYI